MFKGVDGLGVKHACVRKGATPNQPDRSASLTPPVAAPWEAFRQLCSVQPSSAKMAVASSRADRLRASVALDAPVADVPADPQREYGLVGGLVVVIHTVRRW
jgi:hypothetical protein